MLKKTFQVATETTTYPVAAEWDDLDQEQRDACRRQGYDPEHSLFWFMGDIPFSFEGDLHPLLGVFDCFGGYCHYLTYLGSTYLAKFNVVNGFTASITLAEVKEIQE